MDDNNLEQTPFDQSLLHASWMHELRDEFDQTYLKELKSFLESQDLTDKVIFPRKSEYFLSLNCTPLSKVKVVVLGQDPYHGPGQAHGLCFSVRPGVRPPPSLKNIYKELRTDLNIEPPNHGCLLPWALQGVLLLNSVLTVEAGKPASHKKKGWERFTNKVIEVLNRREDPIAFILWGAYAQKKGEIIDRQRHLVIEGVHPSPLSSHRGFFGSRPFSQVAKFHEKHHMTPIDWSLPEKDIVVRQYSELLGSI